MSQKNARGAGEYSGDEHQDEPGERRRRAIRSLRMSESEQRARERRRTRFQLRHAKKSSDNTPEVVGDQTEVTAEAGDGGPSEQVPIDIVEIQERKPWESLVVGNLGDNLSHIERKNREIEQQRFIVQFHEEHSPDEVGHNRRILGQLIRESAQMEDNEENNMPECVTIRKLGGEVPS